MTSLDGPALERAGARRAGARRADTSAVLQAAGAGWTVPDLRAERWARAG